MRTRKWSTKDTPVITVNRPAQTLCMPQIHINTVHYKRLKHTLRTYCFRQNPILYRRTLRLALRPIAPSPSAILPHAQSHRIADTDPSAVRGENHRRCNHNSNGHHHHHKHSHLFVATGAGGWSPINDTGVTRSQTVCVLFLCVCCWCARVRLNPRRPQLFRLFVFRFLRLAEIQIYSVAFVLCSILPAYSVSQSPYMCVGIIYRHRFVFGRYVAETQAQPFDIAR